MYVKSYKVHYRLNEVHSIQDVKYHYNRIKCHISFMFESLENMLLAYIC